MSLTAAPESSGMLGSRSFVTALGAGAEAERLCRAPAPNGPACLPIAVRCVLEG